MTENLQHHPANRNFAGEAPLADLLPHVFSLDGLRDRKVVVGSIWFRMSDCVSVFVNTGNNKRRCPLEDCWRWLGLHFGPGDQRCPVFEGTKRPFTLAHCVALDLPLELIQSLLKRAVQVGQILEERKACWDHTGQLLLLHLSNLREYNVNQRKLFNDHGQIQASLFYTKCEAVHELMLRDFLSWRALSSMETYLKTCAIE